MVSVDVHRVWTYEITVWDTVNGMDIRRFERASSCGACDELEQPETA